MKSITGHTVVYNEDRFLYFAVLSVLPYLDKILIADTGSTDHTVSVIRSLQKTSLGGKIVFEERGKVSPQELVALRSRQVQKTNTEFFFLLDGDEIWSENEIQKFLAAAQNLPKTKLALACRTRNVVGDLLHYLPVNTGNYEILGRKGHFNIRLFRRTPDLSLSGVYPLEAYCYGGIPIDKLGNKLEFVDAWYLHATHLPRSTQERAKKQKVDLGLRMPVTDLPKIFFQNHPEFIPDPPLNRSRGYLLSALLQTPLRKIKHRLS